MLFEQFVSNRMEVKLMGPLELAQQYMDILFTGKDVGRLGEILAEDCRFVGPFYQFDSARAYIDSLQSGLLSDFGFDIIKAYEDADSACLIYQFSKPGVDIPMAQVFEVTDNRISSILLLFDSAAFDDLAMRQD